MQRSEEITSKLRSRHGILSKSARCNGHTGTQISVYVILTFQKIAMPVCLEENVEYTWVQVSSKKL